MCLIFMASSSSSVDYSQCLTPCTVLMGGGRLRGSILRHDDVTEVAGPARAPASVPLLCAVTGSEV